MSRSTHSPAITTTATFPLLLSATQSTVPSRAPLWWGETSQNMLLKILQEQICIDWDPWGIFPALYVVYTLKNIHMETNGPQPSITCGQYHWLLADSHAPLFLPPSWPWCQHILLLFSTPADNTMQRHTNTQFLSLFLDTHTFYSKFGFAEGRMRKTKI